MNAQAEQMKAMVNELVAIVGGDAAVSQGQIEADRHRRSTMKAGHSKNKALTIAKKNVKGEPLSFHPPRQVNPDDIIPMDENDFKDF
jgi:methyl-accepting chemotaxis protein